MSDYPRIIDAGRYFEPSSLSKEDLERAALYASNSQRTAQETKFASYGEYLDSLEMIAEIDTFKPVYIERIAQLTNKTNQYNLTTRRYTLAEMEMISRSPSHIGLYGKLSDRFGDNGLISVVVGAQQGSDLHIDLWLMSCRVLKRDMEVAMLDCLVRHALDKGVTTLTAAYLPTKKNAMVSDHYERLGFISVTPPHNSPEGATYWTLDLANYSERSKHVRLLSMVAV